MFPSAACTGTVLHDETVAIDAAGQAQTATATAVAAGTYAWKVTFTPDTIANPNYVAAATTCSPAQSDETATISYAGNSPIH